MKLTALYNVDGLIMAAVLHESGEDGPRPVPSAQLLLHEFEVPLSWKDRPLDQLCRMMRVDVRSKQLVEMTRAAD